MRVASRWILVLLVRMSASRTLASPSSGGRRGRGGRRGKCVRLGLNEGDGKGWKVGEENRFSAVFGQNHYTRSDYV
jgi:hypothetical protein